MEKRGRGLEVWRGTQTALLVPDFLLVLQDEFCKSSKFDKKLMGVTKAREGGGRERERRERERKEGNFLTRLERLI